VVVYLAVSAVVLIAASGQEQKLVLVYAVAVFVSFLAGLTAMARFSLRDRRPGLAAVNIAGAVTPPAYAHYYATRRVSEYNATLCNTGNPGEGQGAQVAP
jgi:hypothetical protein